MTKSQSTPYIYSFIGERIVVVNYHRKNYLNPHNFNPVRIQKILNLKDKFIV